MSNKPAKIPLKAGLAWVGSMTVYPRNNEGKHCVKFDAKDSRGMHVYDQFMMAPELIIDWTGVDPETLK